MKDALGERTKISPEMEGGRDELAQEEREKVENTEGLSREMGKHELRPIRSSVMVLSPSERQTC